MKKLLLSACVAFLLLLNSCKKDENKSSSYTCTTCVTTAEALAAHDNISKGVYKGIVVGSSGTIKFDLMNSGSTIKAYLVIDGVAAELTSNVTWRSGVAYAGAFTGKLSGQDVTINFSVDYDGSNPIITSSNIPGHSNAVFTLVKETSNMLIEGFEGTYTTSANGGGTFNMLLSRAINQWGGIARENGSSSNSEIEGTIDGGGRLLEDGTDYRATLTGDKIDGVFKDSNGATVTVTGKRTL